MNTEQNKDPNSYNVVPYFSHPFAHTHPNRLSVIARLFGMQPPDISKCRVLELGCSDGANLIPMAVQFPESEFIGVDLSEKEVEQGEKMIKALNLKNIKIHCKNILDINQDMGKFDYIIAHGIFSWVPVPVRKKILEICNMQLTPNGVAYISYNCYPGWHIRGMVRDMMRYHVRAFNDPKQKIQQSRALVNFLSTSVPVENNPYGMLLKSELTQMQRWPDYYFYHDSLEETNEPLHFHQFIEAAMQEGLQFLGEADFSSMVVHNFPQNVKETLQRIAPNILSMEQYMDFVRNRMFRQTLLCHKDVQLSRNINIDVFKDFYFLSGVRATSPNPEIDSNKAEEFLLPNGMKITTQHPVSKAIWRQFEKVAPLSMNISEILQGIKSQVKTNGDIEKPVLELLLQGFLKGAVLCYSGPFKVTEKVSQFPVASPLVRYQAAQQAWVTNQRHEPINIDKLRQSILILLDGKHDKKSLLKILHGMIDKKEIVIAQQNVTVDDKEKAKKLLSEQIDILLGQIAKAGLLIG